MDDNRWLALEGAVNMRDLGGLPLVGGGSTLPFRILRSDNLQGLTPTDVRRLVDGYGLRTVLDLRTATELRSEGPGPLAGEPVDHRHHSLFPEGGVATDVEADRLLPRITGDREAAFTDAEWVIDHYLGYLRDAPQAVVGAMRVLADRAAGPTVMHCAAGKDRTGVLTALALSCAGVEREAIVEDYLLTGQRIEAIINRLRQSPTYAEDLDDSPADSHAPMPGVMDGFLAALDEHAGGPVGWLAAQGFGAAEVAALRDRLAS